MVVARARVVAKARAVARARSECSDGGKGGGVVVEWLWIGGGKGEGVGGRVTVEWWWIHGGKGMATLQQELWGSSFAAAALRQCSGGGQLGRGGSSFTSARHWLRWRQWQAWRRHDY